MPYPRCGVRAAAASSTSPPSLVIWACRCVRPTAPPRRPSSISLASWRWTTPSIKSANTISPGFILTERSSRRSGGKERARAVAGPRHLLNRPGEPEEIAAGAVYLASDDAAFVTATDLLIDGGYIAFKGRIDADGRPAMI